MVCSSRVSNSKSAGFIFPRRCLVLCVWTPKKQLTIKEAHGDNNCRLESRKSRHVGYVGRRSPGTVTEPLKSCVPHHPTPHPSLRLSPRPSSSVQWGHAGSQTAPCVLRRRWTRCVKFSWGEAQLYNQPGCAACTTALLIYCQLKAHTHKKKKKKKEKAHHTEISAKTRLCWDDY